MNSVDMFNTTAQAIILGNDTVIKPFDCANEELNDFLFHNAKNYTSSLLSVTYLIQTEAETVAYYSLANDRITKDDEEKTAWNKINRTIANEKRRKSYPAVKIGRLAVSKQYTGSGLGKTIIQTVRELYTNYLQQSGCRFITVDAYCSALKFYEKNGFKYLTDKDKFSETRAMYFDLKALNG
jgi:predicted GNAT family N-acyltransferase